MVNGQKQGGNVASYFCTPDGTVLHAVPGPVTAAEFLREARWAVEVHNLAATQSRGDPLAYRLAIRKAHLDRLGEEFNAALPPAALPRITVPVPPDEWVLHLPAAANLGTQAKASVLLAAYPVAKIEDLYPVVWRHVLGERVSNAPVQVAGR